MTQNSSNDAMKNKTSLGIMGGTFDPIHVGHLTVAEIVRTRLDLAKVVFVPAYCPPHKSLDDITPAKDRFAMVREAIAENSHFEVSGIEVGNHCPVYAGDTIRAFKEMEGNNTDIYFITGLDAILIIVNWDRARINPGLCRLVAAARPGYDKDDIERKIPGEFRPYVTIVEEPSLAVSSTDIRRRVKTGQSIAGMVPQAVMDYICLNRLYV